MNPIDSAERIVDHLIVIASPAERVKIVSQLRKAGFGSGDEAVDATLGVRSHLVPIAGGGFIEVGSEVSPGSFAHGNPFDVTPRLAAVFYTTDDGLADLRRWRGKAGTEQAMAQAGSWKRLDGTMGYFVSLMPQPPASDLFFGLQERRLFPLPYLAVKDAAPALRRITISGDHADLWARRHADLFALSEEAGVVRAGPTEVRFEQRPGEQTQIVATFAVADPEVDIPLVSGRFEFVRQTTSSR